MERQLEACEVLAKQLGWAIAEEVGDKGKFDDNDISAMSGKTRPGFEALLDAMKRGEITGLLCWHPDRLYRRLTDLSRLIEVSGGVEIRTVNGGEIDLSHSTGRMLANILGSVATQESEHKAERQRAAAVQMAGLGKPKWKKAFGYVPDTRSKTADDGTRVVDPVTSKLVEEGYASVLAGGSITDVARAWNKAERPDGSKCYGMNGEPWSASTVSLFLRAPRNAGLRFHNGEKVLDSDGQQVRGTWPHLVDETTWHSTQSVLDSKVRKVMVKGRERKVTKPGRKSVRQHLLTGVLMCGKPDCDGYLGGNWVMQAHRGAPRSHSITYACKVCRGCSIRADHIEPLVYGMVAGRLAREDAIDLLKSPQHDEVLAEQLRVQKQALYSDIRKANAEYDDGVIDGQRLAGRTARVTEKLAVIERVEQDQERVRVLDGLPLGTPEVADAIRELSPDRFRAVINLLVVFTVMSVGKGHRPPSGERFDPERVRVDWKR
ncbi:recombinase family protein [soil metagenome]